METDRRNLLKVAGLGATAGLVATPAAAQTATRPTATAATAPATDFGLQPDSGVDVTPVFQRAIDQTAEAGVILELAPGRYVTRTLVARPGTQILGAGQSTKLISISTGPLLEAGGGAFIRLLDLEIDGVGQPLSDPNTGLIAFADVSRVTLQDLTVRGSRGRGISLSRCGGTISNVDVADIAHTGIFTIDSTGLLIERCTVAACGDNGIQVWRSNPGEDGTQVLNNRISTIRSDSGGTGQNGNGINAFRANSVLVQGNRITDCTYSAIRGNGASNIMMTGNHIERIGEVALYAEFAFDGAVISNNLINSAATGISVTNFNEGGRLAVVQGNLVRNLFRRDFEPVDKRGNGIAVEADAAISGNTIEGAPTAGLWIGWGKYMRNVNAVGNVVRESGYGVVVSGDVNAGSALIAQNIFSEIKSGAVRLADLGTVYGPDLINGSQLKRIAVTGNVVS